MRRATKILALAVALTAAGSFPGCNERLDDPTQSDGILTIEKVDPVNIAADITPLDPNGVNATPITDETVTITVKNRPRNENTGNFTDIFVKTSEQYCTFGGSTITSGTALASFTIPSNGTAGVTITAVTVQEKGLASLGDTWQCFARLIGEDLAGNPAKSDYAAYVINFVDK